MRHVLPSEMQRIAYDTARKEIARQLEDSGIAAKTESLLGGPSRYFPGVSLFTRGPDSLAIVAREPYHRDPEGELDPLNVITGWELQTGFETVTTQAGSRRKSSRLVTIADDFGNGVPIPTQPEIFSTEDLALVVGCIGRLAQLRQNELPSLEKDLRGWIPMM